MFKKHKNKPSLESPNHHENNNVHSSNNIPVSPSSPVTKSLLQFHCQLAHGSPTVFVSGFSNVKELYQKIADSFDFPASEIIFCTLNTHKMDMRKLLGGQIGLEDFIFAHKKGTPKEVELQKTEDALGLTITDNGAGYAFIKRIKEGSVIHNIPHIQVGDHIERLDGVNMIGKRHFEVAKFLKDIPKGTTFVMRLVEPLRTGFSSIAPKSNFKSNKKGYGNGKGTLRFKAGGNAEIQEQEPARGTKRKTELNMVDEQIKFVNICTEAPKKQEITEYEALSITIAKKLEKMKGLQALYAETIIHSVLRRGLLNKLTEFTDICDKQCNKTIILSSSNTP